MNDEPPDDRKGRSGRLRSEDRRGRNEHQLFPSQEELKDTALHNPEKSWEDPQSKKLGRKVIITLVSIVFLCAIGLLAFVLSTKDNSTHHENRTALAPPQNFIEKASPAEIENSIQSCVSGFMNASTNEERSRFIIGGHESLPALDEYYSRPDVFPPSDFGKIAQSNQAAFGGITMHTVLAMESDESSGWVFNVLPTQTEMKIDWSSSVAYGEKSWPDFQKSKRSTPAIMRILLAQAPNDRKIADPEKFGFCKVYIRGDDQSLPGFFPLESQVASTLKKIVPPGGRQPIRAKLRWNPDGTAIEVVEVIHNFWIDLAHYQKIFESTVE